MADKGTTTLGLHMGNTLVALAERYPGLMRSIVETVQNAIDADASRIFIGVDQRKKFVLVTDNGVGASVQEMEETLAAIAESRKIGRQGKIGRFGIGFMAPLTKCKQFQFVSWKRKRGAKPVGWMFIQEAIASQRSSIEIPHTELAAMPPIEPQFAKSAADFADGWRTAVRMMGVSEDKVVSRVTLDELETSIRGSLDKALREKEVSIRIVLIDEKGRSKSRDVTPQDFLGELLGEFRLQGENVGRVKIRLFRARLENGVRKGEIRVSEGVSALHAVRWKDFASQAALVEGGTFYGEAFKILGSGYFEGEIWAENLELLPERNKYRNTEALLEFYVMLDTWFQEVGAKFYQEAQDRDFRERYNRITRSVLDAFRDLAQDPLYSPYFEALRSEVDFGLIRNEHAERPIDGQDDSLTLRTNSKGDTADRTNGSSGRSVKKDGGLPTTIVDVEEGKRRSRVKNDSIGVSVEVTDFINGPLFRVDLSICRITFNSNHKTWTMVDGTLAARRTAKHDKQVEKLQLYVLVKVLEIYRLPEGERELAVERLEEGMGLFAKMFILS